MRLNGRCPLKERDQLLENLHPMLIDLPSQSIIEASRMGMNRIPVGCYFGGGALIMIHPLSSFPFHSIVFVRSTDMPCSNWFGHRANSAREPVRKPPLLGQRRLLPVRNHTQCHPCGPVPRPPENGVNCNSAVCGDGRILRGTPSSLRTDQWRGSKPRAVFRRCHWLFSAPPSLVRRRARRPSCGALPRVLVRVHSLVLSPSPAAGWPTGPRWRTLAATADSGDCDQGFRLNATMRSDRMRPPVPTKAAGVSLPA